MVIGEVGWPSDGVDIGNARASRVNQALFLRRFFATAEQRGLDYFVMEAFDQPWKTSFEGRAAGYWGMFDLDRQAKWAMTCPGAGNARLAALGGGQRGPLPCSPRFCCRGDRTSCCAASFAFAALRRAFARRSPACCSR